MKHIMEFNEFINEKLEDTYDYGCAMLFFDFPELMKVQDAINPKDIYEKEDDKSFGLEDEPHCTLLYGLHKEVTVDEVKEIVNKINFGKIKLHNASLFENEYDVFKFDVGYVNEDDNFLHECNESLSKLPNTNDYSDYHPHATIAYIKKGKGKKYADMIKSESFDIKPSHCIFTQPSGKQNKIKIKTT